MNPNIINNPPNSNFLSINYNNNNNILGTTKLLKISNTPTISQNTLIALNSNNSATSS